MEVQVEEVISTIRGRGISLTTKGAKIVARPPDQLTPEEKAFITGHRAEVISYLNSQSAMPAPEQSAPEPETPEAAYQRGYYDGIRHATEELRANPKVIADKPATVKTPEQQIAEFVEWQHGRGLYYVWEPETMQALREAMGPGDKIVPRYAYSCYVVGADGSEREFHRVPKRK
jgi:hypothetical protein